MRRTKEDDLKTTVSNPQKVNNSKNTFTFLSSVIGYDGPDSTHSIYKIDGSVLEISVNTEFVLGKTKDGVFSLHLFPRSKLNSGKKSYIISPEYHDRPFIVYLELAGRIYLYSCRIKPSKSDYYLELLIYKDLEYKPIKIQDLQDIMDWDAKCKIYFTTKVLILAL